MNDERTEDEVRIHTDRAALCRAVAEDLATVLAAAVEERGAATAVLTGGGTGTAILTALADRALAEHVDWSRVHLWWGDERFLPAGDPERNEVQATGALIGTLVADHHLPPEHIHRMPALVGSAGSAAELVDVAARDYASALAEHAAADRGPDPRLPVLDVVLLGMGPDGHVASLFPGLPGPRTRGRTVVGVTDSPKAPAERISLTMEALCTARHLWFVVTGADKAETVDAVQAARAEHHFDADRWPASAVSGTEQTCWHLDRAAAGLRPLQKD